MILAVALAVALSAPADPAPAPVPHRVVAPSRSGPTPTHLAALPPRGWSAFMSCVIDRESGGSPTAINHGSGAAGLAQFLPKWRHGLPFMVRDRLRRNGMPARQATAVRVMLSGLPIYRWPATYQRVGMAEVLDRGGAFHWHLSGSRCEGLRP